MVTTNTPTANLVQTEKAGSALAVSTSQAFWSAQQIAALKQIGIQDAPNADLAVFLNFAQRTGLDPFARQIYMIGRRQKAGDKWTTKWTIQASIDGLRIVAERSGDYAGQVGPEYCGEDGEWRDTWTSHQPPVAARIGVLRHGFSAPLYAVAYYDEYVQTDRDGKATSMWATKPRLMLAKCAEALALRKAFPNDLAGLYTSDEMGSAAANPPAPEPQAVDIATGEVIEVQEQADELATDPQLKAIAAIASKLGVKDREERHHLVARIIARDIGSSFELTKAEAHTVIDTLKPLAESDDPVAAYAAWEW